MKKTLIAVALATLSATSMADVILYGQIKGGVEVSKIKDIDGTLTQIVDYGSRIGFKGHEDLSSGLQAIWQLEQKVNIGGVQTGFGTRDSFIGLKGNFGQVTVGHQHNAIGYTNDKLDIWEYKDDAAGLALFTRSTALNKRSTSVRYVTPDFGGFTVEGSVTPSDNNEENPSYSAADKAIYSLGLHYKNAGFFADVAGGYAHRVSTETDGSGKVKNLNGHQIVAQAGYDAQPWFAGVAYQNTKRAETTELFEGVKTVNEVAGTVAYNVTEPLRLKASVGYGFGIKEEDGTKWLGNGRYIQGVVGADYALSKRTQANAQVGYLQAGRGEDKLRQGAVSVGLKHAF